MALLKYFLPFVFVLAATTSEARVYCCDDDHGRRICGDILPVQCQKRAYDELNSQGVLKEKHSAPLTAEQRAQRDAEIARKKHAEEAAAEQERKDKALLASYTSVADIDAKLERTLVGAHADIKTAKERLEAAQARHDKLSNSVSRYSNGNKPVPETLQDNLRDSEVDLAVRQADLKKKGEELTAIKERFERDRKRFVELTSQPRTAPPVVIPARPTR